MCLGFLATSLPLQPLDKVYMEAFQRVLGCLGTLVGSSVSHLHHHKGGDHVRLWVAFGVCQHSVRGSLHFLGRELPWMQGAVRFVAGSHLQYTQHRLGFPVLCICWEPRLHLCQGGDGGVIGLQQAVASNWRMRLDLQ